MIIGIIDVTELFTLQSHTVLLSADEHIQSRSKVCIHLKNIYIMPVLSFNDFYSSLFFTDSSISKAATAPKINCANDLCKYKVRDTYFLIVSLPRSGRKNKLSPAAERKLVRMVKSEPKTTKSKSAMN